ncbi:hypothetical protein [Iningainema tapete]|uniref:Uncharacterized protein n=1 Tax=Iningainema tapete BLCC-T55 TaxID=2748662 RepID=A0A8J7BXH5_9CYAN|nr:hypothetical protein [Iningainema tapete]MBD2772923.1 hypothetical protein [Iningainema tapete BLCC-T55]
MKAIEVTGTVNEKGELHLEQPLFVAKSSRVRVILLFPETEEIDEQEWLKAAATNPVFAFLHDPEEDIYTLEDGKPLDEG